MADLLKEFDLPDGVPPEVLTEIEADIEDYIEELDQVLGEHLDGLENAG